MSSLNVLNLPNPSRRTLVQEFTQSVTEMSIINLLAVRDVRPASETDKLAAMCERIV
jgi:hypothetical protein